MTTQQIRDFLEGKTVVGDFIFVDDSWILRDCYNDSCVCSRCIQLDDCLSDFETLVEDLIKEQPRDSKV